MNSEDWFKAHTEYLKSPEWAFKRGQVLTRDEYRCQAKLKGCHRDAVQVHHLTYTHWRNEPLFDLASICVKCHDQITAMDRAARFGASKSDECNTVLVEGKSHHVSLEEVARALAHEMNQRGHTLDLAATYVGVAKGVARKAFFKHRVLFGPQVQVQSPVRPLPDGWSISKESDGTYEVLFERREGELQHYDWANSYEEAVAAIPV